MFLEQAINQYNLLDEKNHKFGAQKEKSEWNVNSGFVTMDNIDVILKSRSKRLVICRKKISTANGWKWKLNAILSAAHTWFDIYMRLSIA